MKKRAIITGITGQDGAYLAQLLLSKGYEVYGTYRSRDIVNTDRLDELGIKDSIDFYYLNINDFDNIISIIKKVKPAEIYNLGSLSSVAQSFEQPLLTGEATGISVLKLLEAIRLVDSNIRFYQASSSEMFGNVKEFPQNEETAYNPVSPYGVSKLFAHLMVTCYRKTYGLFCCTGILYNHESPLRGENYVTRKITQGVAKIKLGLESKLYLGNLDIKRDWGYAPEYVEAMWLMMQKDEPDDYVIATGETHSLLEFVQKAFECVELDWSKYVEVDKKYYRPAEINIVVGDARKAWEKLGWKHRTGLDELIREMVNMDLKKLTSTGVKNA